MQHSIVNLEGKALASSVDLPGAKSALIDMVNAQPDLQDELLILSYDDDGSPVGEGLMFSDIVDQLLPTFGFGRILSMPHSGHAAFVTTTAATRAELIRKPDFLSGTELAGPSEQRPNPLITRQRSLTAA
jgi:hypothetical protein